MCLNLAQLLPTIIICIWQKYSVRFRGGAAYNQLYDADEIIPEQNFLQTKIPPGDKLKFPSSNEDIFLTKILCEISRIVRGKAELRYKLFYSAKNTP
jgi:hypothetical protein